MKMKKKLINVVASYTNKPRILISDGGKEVRVIGGVPSARDAISDFFFDNFDVWAIENQEDAKIISLI